MKKQTINQLISLAIVVVLTVGLIACSKPAYDEMSGDKETTTEVSNTTSTPSTADTSTPATEDTTSNTTDEETPADTTAPVVVEPVRTADVNVGLGIVIDKTSSKSATDSANGLGQTDATIAAVVVDKDGRVLRCAIDVAQTKINFNNEGVVVTDPNGTFLTKQELGFDYGMVAYAKAPYEWFEQANSFAEYCVGKTAAEIAAIPMKDHYIDDSVDLKATVTIHATDFQEAVVKAINNAVVPGAAATDRLGLAVVTNISNSKDATADAEGLTQAYSTITAITTDKNGTITSAVIDAYQSNVNFNKSGEVTTDLTAASLTKNELKDGYGMRPASGIGKEWFEQAEGFAAYVVGKNAAGIDGIAIDKGYAVDADLLAAATIHVTDFKNVVAKAIVNAAKSAAVTKTGLGIVIDKTSSKSATDSANGVGQTDATIAAVTVDGDGRVVRCAIDVNQIKVNFNNTGAIVTDLASTFRTKQEQGFDYGMVAYANAPYEWFEQANSFADYCVGKTAAEIAAIPMKDHYIDDSVDLKATVTIHATDFQEAVIKAINNAVVAGASTSDKLGLAVVTNINNSKDATADAEGLTQAYATITVVTTDANDVITSSVIDAYQANVNFNAAGEVTTDLTAASLTKNELKDGYGMRPASGIGKEWFEQAAGFAKYVVGKDAAGIDGIAIDKGYAVDADLLAAATIHVTDFKAVVAKAIVNAANSVSPVKTGLGIVIDKTSSKSATDSANGVGQTDATIAAVTVGPDGKVVKCEIDVNQIKVNFNNAGAVVTDLASTFRTKQEQGFDYGMVAFAKAPYEWFEQADSFAAYCIGKTAAEIAAIPMKDHYIDDSIDLKATVTIHATDFQEAVIKAINNAVEGGAKSNDSLGLAVVTNINNSKDATADAEGLTQAYATITAVTTNNGVITSSVIDAYQANVNFNAAGEVTTDLTAASLTKNELKDGYGMRPASGIGKEWFEQAEGFAKYVVGKDAAGVDGIAIDKGYAVDADLLAAATIHVTDFKSVVGKAIKNAR